MIYYYVCMTLGKKPKSIRFNFCSVIKAKRFSLLLRGDGVWGFLSKKINLYFSIIFHCNKIIFYKRDLFNV